LQDRSRLTEKILVQQLLRTSLPIDIIDDQLAFRPTGSSSTTSIVVKFIHYATLKSEEKSCIICLPLDFSKAFNVVRHSVLLQNQQT